jgi:hypothetical protein
MQPSTARSRICREKARERFSRHDAARRKGDVPTAAAFWVCGNIGGCFALMLSGPTPQSREQLVSWCNRFLLWDDVRLDGRQELQQQLGGGPDLPESNPTSEELLLRAWARWGPACLERMIGDFSLALWNAQEQVLWCARDFLGPRPFYYAQANELCSASATLCRCCPGLPLAGVGVGVTQARRASAKILSQMGQALFASRWSSRQICRAQKAIGHDLSVCGTVYRQRRAAHRRTESARRCWNW